MDKFIDGNVDVLQNNLRIDGLMDRQIDGLMDRWTDGQMDRRIEQYND